jgi:hypothetical protein
MGSNNEPGIRAETLERLAASYRAAAIEASNLADSRRQNRAARRAHAFALKLRATPDGRAAVLLLLNDEDPYVRLWSATDALKWAPEAAVEVLERLVEEHGRGAFEANVTLRLFREGNLDLDY